MRNDETIDEDAGADDDDDGPDAGAGAGAAPPTMPRRTTLSSWNQQQLELLQNRERQRNSSALTLAMEAECGLLSDRWLGRLEQQTEAFSFMIYRYRGELSGAARRRMLSHREVLNALGRHRRGELPDEGLAEAIRAPASEEPSTPAEGMYRDPARVNEPADTGRYSWTRREVAEDPDA